MERYLAIHALPERGDWKEALTRLALRARVAGVHPRETFYSPSRGRAYTLYDAPSVESIARLHADAALPAPEEVVPAERVYTDLLAEGLQAQS